MEFVPTILGDRMVTIKVDSRMVNLGLWDTAGQDEYSCQRKLDYTNADVFLVIFDVTEEASFKNALNKVPC